MAEEADQEDKTEEPTQRRIEQAIERGEVPKSQEISTFFGLGAGTLALMLSGSLGMREFVVEMRGLMSNAHQVAADPAGMLQMANFATKTWFSVLALPFAFTIVAGIAGGLLMHRPLWTFDPLEPKFNRISPLAGFKRIFGKEAFVQFAKSLAKFTIVCVVMLLVLWPERGRLDLLVQLDPLKMLDAAWVLSLKLLGSVLAIFAFVAGLDVLYQRHTWRERLKMTREELKQEFKETEGSPEVKQHIRKIRQEMLKKRMMAQVPKASVIITNPTHYAVALRYETGMNAPMVLAKGVDSLALKIREIAALHEIPIIENPPLARALHARVEIDDEIPEEHYKAVAEVIGYVMRLRRSRR